MTMHKSRFSNSCDPRFATRRRPERETLGTAVGIIAERIGQPLMPWQQLVADVGLELTEDGLPAYRSVTFTVPRQSGKTTLILSWELQRAIGWAQVLGPQRIAYTAQTGKDAREKVIDDQVPVLERHAAMLGLQKVTRAHGSEAVQFKNGSRLIVLASNKESGHGKTIDLAIKDELFADVDNRRDQALHPAMVTRPHAQIVSASTMGTEESVALNRAVTTGRKAIEIDKGTGVAYFEWSADPDDDPGDPEIWARCMPALGRTITLPVVEEAFESLPLEEFRRAYLNIATATLEDRVISRDEWEAVCSVDVVTEGKVFGFDVNPERSAAAIVVVGAGPTIEVVDYRPGTSWLVDRLTELGERYKYPLAFDRAGPAASFGELLRRNRKLKMTDLDARAMQRACGYFYDTVTTGDTGLRVRTHPDLDRAIEGASKRESGDAWLWGRKASRYDISPLVAATVALWTFANPAKPTALVASFG